MAKETNERSEAPKSNGDTGDAATPGSMTLFGMDLPSKFMLWFAVVMAVTSVLVIIFRTREVLSGDITLYNIYIGILNVTRDIATTIPVVSLSVALAVHFRRMRMTIAAYFEQKAKEERAKERAKGRAELRVEVIEWDKRRLEAEARGEPFDEPLPGSEEDTT